MYPPAQTSSLRSIRQAASGRLAAACLLALLAGTHASADTARLTVRVIDEQGAPLPARAWVDVGEKRFFEPVEPASVTVYARDRSFSCDGTFTMELPPGKAVVHVERGKEHVPVNLELTLGPDAKLEKKITLQRWTDMPAKGWSSADLHVHLGHDNPQILRQLALADDVHLVPAFTYWLRGRGETWQAAWPEGVTTDPIAVDATHLVTRNHIEIERIDRNAPPGGTIGATFLFNLTKPVTADRAGEHFPTDARLCLAARAESPRAVFDSDKPSWAETVIGAALGVLDTVQVCHNHFHRSATLAGGWGMIGPLAPGESNDASGDGLFHRTNRLYYRLLNCGFPLGVSGGSAIGVMPVPAGFHRVYAKIDGPLSAEKLWAAIKSGRSFATTGPMLTLTAGGEEIGETLRLSSAGAASKSVKLSTSVKSIEPLESLQLVANGEVVASLDLEGRHPDPVLEAKLDHEFSPSRSGWIAARALFRAPDGRLRQAHTSPIYLAVDDKPIAFAEDATYMLRWIEILEELARSQSDRFPDSAAREEVLAIYAEARAVYEAIAGEARDTWGDP